jgi:hypothetical protein
MFYSIYFFFELKSEVPFGTSKLSSFFSKSQSKTPHFLLQRDVKQSELIGKLGLNPNHCSIPMEKVFFLQMFAPKQTFDRIFFTPRNSPYSLVLLKADFSARRLQRIIDTEEIHTEL